MTKWTLGPGPIRIGVDIGWSEKQKSSAVAILGASPGLGWQGAAYRRNDGSLPIWCGLFRHSEMLAFLEEFGRQLAGRMADLTAVIDGPIGKTGEPTSNRPIDSWFRRGEFNNRMQPLDIASKDGRTFVQATYRVVRRLFAAAGSEFVEPWWGVRKSSSFVYAETNPTVGLALLCEPQPRGPGQLPSRKRPVDVGGKKYGAKSDWYWHLGAKKVIATILGSAEVETVRHHEMEAALYCLGVAESICENTALTVGDDAGVYVFPNQVAAGWHAPVRSCGIVAGNLQLAALVPSPIEFEQPVAATNAPETIEDESDRSDRGDEVELILTDNGGVHKNQNDWLEGLSGEIVLHSLDQHQERITLGAANAPDMWTVLDTALELARRRGFTHKHLSKERFIVIPVSIESVGTR